MRLRLYNLRRPYHLAGNIGQTTPSGRRKYRHPKSWFGILWQANCAAQNVSPELAPVSIACPTAGEAQAAVQRRAQHVEVVEAEPFDEGDAFEQRGKPINLIFRVPETKCFRIRSDEGKPFAP